jgi:uncharacterized damage-inducible protein DinB
MSVQGLRDYLTQKFEEIQRRLLTVIDQLNDEELNWRPNGESNSVANLVVHIEGNIKERIGKGILQHDFARDRDSEFEKMTLTKQQLISIVNESFGELVQTARGATEQTLMQTQRVRGKERTHADILMQCSAHFSEHLGQVLYIGKLLKGGDYVTTSIPRKRE